MPHKPHPDICNALGREPDFIVWREDGPYLLRWYVIPRNRFFNIYLHKFIQSDEDRALHDHPWWSIGMILKGEYIEHVPDDSPIWKALGIEATMWDKYRTTRKIRRKAWHPVFRSSTAIHRVELFRQVSHFENPESMTIKDDPVWTIFITGPRIREWGFWCKKGFVHNQQFIKKVDGGNHAGKGCE